MFYRNGKPQSKLEKNPVKFDTFFLFSSFEVNFNWVEKEENFSVSLLEFQLASQIAWKFFSGF